MSDISQFQVESVVDGSDVLVRVVGELDLTTAPQLEAALSGPHSFRLDLTLVSFMDSYGVRALLNGYRAVTGEGGSVRIVAASRQVRRVLDVTGAGRVLGLDGPSPK